MCGRDVDGVVLAIKQLVRDKLRGLGLAVMDQHCSHKGMDGSSVNRSVTAGIGGLAGHFPENLLGYSRLFADLS